MRKTREILRLRWQLQLSHREEAVGTGASVGAVHNAVARAKTAGLDWSAVQALGDTELEAKLYGHALRRARRSLPDLSYLHAERSKVGDVDARVQACFTTRTGGAPTRARTTKRCCDHGII